MNLSQLMKKGYIQIDEIDEKITKECSIHGLLEKTRLYATGICANGYHIVLCDDRILALPQWICRGIRI